MGVRVGKRYLPTVGQWPEMVDFCCSKLGYELRFFWNSPQKQEIAAVKKGRIDFGVKLDREAILIFYRIEGACDWSYTPFDWFSVGEEHRYRPEEGALEPTLQVVLTDAKNGVVRAIRHLELSSGIVEAIDKAIARQIETGTTWLDEQLEVLAARYEKPADAIDESMVVQYDVAP